MREKGYASVTLKGREESPKRKSNESGSELAVCYLGLGDDEKAMDLFRKAEQVNSECGVVHNYQVVLANIGNVYLHRRDYFTAISYYQRALTLPREIRDPVSVKKWTRNINLAYARIRFAVDQQSSRFKADDYG